jgi:two-component system sensor histidine kinase RpfC
VINVETLRLLEELGSSPEFMENLAEVFIADTTRLLERIEVAVASRNCGELRSLVHAMKGSAVSMGAERLTRACAAFGDLTDSELRLQAPSLFRALSEAFAACRVQLGLYLRDKKTSAG